MSTFDYTFDDTFVPRDPNGAPPPPLEGQDLGGYIPGAVLPLVTPPSLLSFCRQSSGQYWDEALRAGLPISPSNKLIPFTVKDVLAEGESASTHVLCSPAILYNADTDELVNPQPVFNYGRYTDGKVIYLLQPGAPFGQGSLKNGRYFLQIGNRTDKTYISEIFEVRCNLCNLLRIRLSNPVPIGDLLYGTVGLPPWQQWFYAEGELDGPTFEETETIKGSDKTASSLVKSYTLRLPGVSEYIADALARAGQVRDFAVGFSDGSGNVVREVIARAYRAAPRITANADGTFDVEVVMPVQISEWRASECDVPDYSLLTPANCV